MWRLPLMLIAPRRKYAFWGMFSLFVLTGIVLGAFANRSGLEYVTVKPAFLNYAQKPRNRTWRTVSWSRGLTLNANRGIFREPYSLRLDREGNLYIMDLSDLSVKKLNS